jgi:hypothetical protein
MGYYLTINSLNLNTHGLKTLPEGVDELWKLDDDGTVSLDDYYIKYDDWWDEDLKNLAKAGVTGEIELFCQRRMPRKILLREKRSGKMFYGECGEWERYVLKDGKVMVFKGHVEFSGDPTIIE